VKKCCPKDIKQEEESDIHATITRRGSFFLISEGDVP
jgi:hypothetical protein